VAVLGCAVNGIGEASHADFGIAGAKNEGFIFSRGEALRKVPTDQLVDTLFAEIDKYVSSGRVEFDAAEAAAAANGLERIEAASAGELTPERMAAMEAAAVAAEAEGAQEADPETDLDLVGLGSGPARLNEDESPVAGRRFTRA
jgi:(E)-4-hydroxy-3-methylbut-2-enyl-diphosphate synthase